MSSIPLPALRTASPASSPTARQPVEQHADSTAFNAHLHQAQQRTPAASTQDHRASTDRPSAGKPASAGASRDASPGKPGDASSQASQSDSASADSSTAGATHVLGLIEQASGGASSGGAGTTTAATDGKPAAGKTQTPTDEPKPAPQGPALPAVAGMPLPAPALTNQPPPSGGGTAASAAPAATVVAGAMASAPTPGQASGAFSATDNGDADDAGDAGDDSASVGALAQNIDTATQASISTLFGSSHNTLLASPPVATAAADPTQNAGDLATLRGALAAPVLATPAAVSAAPHSLNIAANVASPSFSQELGQQVVWLGGQEIKQAQIRLNPQSLGPLDVKVSVEHGRVDVVFAAQHPATVTAVQQSLAQLNQMLGGQGLSLGQTSVGQHAAQHQSGHSSAHTSSAANTNDAEPIDTAIAPLSSPLAVGLVDAFA
jgi:flagellar hook-length control protein FliK